MLKWFLTVLIAGYVAGVGANAAILHLQHPEQPFSSDLEESIGWPRNLLDVVFGV